MHTRISSGYTNRVQILQQQQQQLLFALSIHNAFGLLLTNDDNSLSSIFFLILE